MKYIIHFIFSNIKWNLSLRGRLIAIVIQAWFSVSHLNPLPARTLWGLLRSYSKAEHWGNSTALWPVRSWCYSCLWLHRPWKLLQFECHPWKGDSVPKNQLPEVIPHSWSSEVLYLSSILKIEVQLLFLSYINLSLVLYLLPQSQSGYLSSLSSIKISYIFNFQKQKPERLSSGNFHLTLKYELLWEGKSQSSSHFLGKDLEK